MSSTTGRSDPLPAANAANSAPPSDRDPPTFAEAFRAAIVLSIVFVLGYCLTNWISSCRNTYEAWHGEWELQIPYYWWMIIPYASMDVLYVLAPFACRSRADMRTLVRRASAAVGISATIFLLIPSHFSVPRPEPESQVQAALHSLIELDEPYNVFPSLHLALVVLLTRVYRRGCRTALQTFVRVWFILVAVSTVFTYQHHLLDFTAGLLLGLMCRRYIPEDPQQSVFHSLRFLYERLRSALRGVGLRRAGRTAAAPDAVMS